MVLEVMMVLVGGDNGDGIGGGLLVELEVVWQKYWMW